MSYFSYNFGAYLWKLAFYDKMFDDSFFYSLLIEAYERKS